MHPPTPRQPRPKLGFSEERCVRRVGCALGGAQHKHNTHAAKPSPVLSSRLASVSFTAGMPGQSKRHESPNTKPDQARKEKKARRSHTYSSPPVHTTNEAQQQEERKHKKRQRSAKRTSIKIGNARRATRRGDVSRSQRGRCTKPSPRRKQDQESKKRR